MSFAYNENRSSASRSSEDNVWNKQSPYLQDMYSKAQGLSSRSPSQSVAGFNSAQQIGQGMAADYATSGGQQITDNTSNALNFGLNAADVNQNPYLQSAMNAAIRPLTQNFQENVLSGNEDQALAAGQYGSSRHGIADGIAGRSYMDSVGDITSNMANQGYNTGLNTMMQSINAAPTVQNMGLFGSNVMQNIGGQYQGLQQQMMDSPWNNLSRYQQIVGAPTTLGSSTGYSAGKGWGTSASLTGMGG